MHEIIVNLHTHTLYTDGTGSHAEIVQAALRAGLDAVIVTDHNVWVNGPEDYYKDGERRVLMLVGEEIHDRTRLPKKDHLLVIGAGRELSMLAHDPNRLMEGVVQAGGLAFLAHPTDPAAPAVGQSDISWENWDLPDYTGFELWNGLSEYKSLIRSKLHALWYAWNPKQIAHGPPADTLRKWDELLARGQRLVAIGGSDAHALQFKFGPLRLVLLPYEFHFRAINTHLLLPQPLSGDVYVDRRLILDALRQGHAFVGYDLPAPTRGFRFIAIGMDKTAWMGDEISAQKGITFQIRPPLRTETRLLKDGTVVKTWRQSDTCTYITTQPGVYRVEMYLDYAGRRRGWIFSNPIYVRA